MSLILDYGFDRYGLSQDLCVLSIFIERKVRETTRIVNRYSMISPRKIGLAVYRYN